MMRELLFLIFLFVQCISFAQKGVKPIDIEMNNMKYLFIRFPSEINYVDMGTHDLKAEKSLSNVLKLKAERSNFDKTNLSVVTIDGKYYSFIVEYKPQPSFIAVDMTNVKDSIMSGNIIPSTNIEISDIHTTHLILPTKVADVAILNEDVISQKAEEIDNIVKIKSLTDGFSETSITVVTIDGNIYPMNARYTKNPKDMSISFSEKGKAMFNDVDDVEMRKMSEWIIKKGQYINDLGTQESKMTFQLCSVFTNQDIIAFHLYAKNNSNIDYAIDFVKSYIGSKRSDKHTLTQDEELYNIYSYYSNNSNIIHGKEGTSIVLFYKRFTIPNKRILFFELYEENGGRNLKFTAPYKVIINAKVMDKLD